MKRKFSTWLRNEIEANAALERPPLTPEKILEMAEEWEESEDE